MKDVWNAMADLTRCEIMSMLRKRAMAASEISDSFTVSEVTFSHHLKILREAVSIMEYIKLKP